MREALVFGFLPCVRFRFPDTLMVSVLDANPLSSSATRARLACNLPSAAWPLQCAHHCLSRNALKGLCTTCAGTARTACGCWKAQVRHCSLLTAGGATAALAFGDIAATGGNVPIEAVVNGVGDIFTDMGSCCSGGCGDCCDCFGGCFGDIGECLGSCFEGIGDCFSGMICC